LTNTVAPDIILQETNCLRIDIIATALSHKLSYPKGCIKNGYTVSICMVRNDEEVDRHRSHKSDVLLFYLLFSCKFLI
jgi:hypothetical protein